MKKIFVFSIAILLLGCNRSDTHLLEDPKIEFYTMWKNNDHGYIHYLRTTNKDPKYIDWYSNSLIELCYKYIDTLNFGFPVYDIVIFSGDVPKKATESEREYFENYDNYIFDIVFEKKIYNSSEPSKIFDINTWKKFNHQGIGFSYYNKVVSDLK